MALEGRGGFYTRRRALSEWLCAQAYTDGWAPRLLERLGLAQKIRVVCERVTVERARWPQGTRPLRIAFASDLHAGPTTHPSLWGNAIARIRSEKPDVVLLGGDYVFLHAKHFAPLAAELATIEAPFGRFAVLGNHDLWADNRVIETKLSEAGFRVMINENITLPPPFEHVSIVGLDDPWTGIRDARRAFAGAGDVRIVLVHSPRALDIVGDERFDVMTCGHTHGGHIALPGGIPIISVAQREYAHGRHDVGLGRTLIVSRGIGGIELPLRMFAQPDILSIELGPP